MDLTVLQLNIRNWKTNKYLFSVDLSNYHPHVILLNETSCTENNIKLRGYYVIQNCTERFSGVAILIHNTVQFSIIPTKDKDTLSIKINTSLGPLIIATSYIPPRLNVIPSISINKILDYNLPTLFIADFNAHHPMFHNTTARNANGDARGAQLSALAVNRNLDFLGPMFYTFETNRSKGTPDIVLTSNQFQIFHHQITKGNTFSDHSSIILKISTVPIKVIVNSNLNLNTSIFLISTIF